MKPIFSFLQASKRFAAAYRWLVFLLFVYAGVLFAENNASCQIPFENTAPARYRIEFSDKSDNPYSIDNPEKFLSARSLSRRQKQHIPVAEADLPVNPAYIDSLRKAGARVINISKWFNAATVEVNDSAVLKKIAAFSFVKPAISYRSSLLGKTGSGIQSAITYTPLNYGTSWLQIAMNNGQSLHENGYTGKNMVIAVIDAGFSHADQLPAFEDLWENNRILGTRDFVEPGNNVFIGVQPGAQHGMSVLSIIGGYQQGELIGTAPDASFWLLRSEDGRSEYITEEDNWIAAAEFADSAGADIINTSLGYTLFDNPLQNHSYEDLDGNTTRISRGADMAAAKGILVVVSAGNQGNTPWYYISAPSDADSVLTVGAVDRYGMITAFSGRGPASDGQIKPNVLALGMGTYVATSDGSVKPGNGTSYSAPVITGLAACIWQANPDATAMQVYHAICESGNRFYDPDFENGFGIPDFTLANVLLKASTNRLEPIAKLIVYPNPFHHQLYVFFESPVNNPVNVVLFDVAGKMVFNKTYPGMDGRKYLVINEGFYNLSNGLYIMEVQAGKYSVKSKLIRY